MKGMKWLAGLLVVWMMAVPGFSLEGELAMKELDESFAGLNVGGRMVADKSDTALKRFVISLAYFAEEDGWRSLARVTHPGSFKSSYYKEVMEDVEARLERESRDAFMGLRNAMTLEGEIRKAEKEVTIREKTFGFFAKEMYVYGPWSVFWFPRGLAEAAELVLGGMDRTETLLRGMVYVSLIEVLEDRMREAVLEAVELPTSERVWEAESAFYAYKAALIGSNENALGFKVTDEETERLESAIKALEVLSFDMEDYGIRQLVQLAAVTGP